MSYSPLMLGAKHFSLPRRQHSNGYKTLANTTSVSSESSLGLDSKSAGAIIEERSDDHLSWRHGIKSRWDQRPKGSVPILFVLLTGWLIVVIYLFGENKARETGVGIRIPVSTEPKCTPPTESALKDLVEHLPGWNKEEGLPSCQYSGYVAITDDTVTPGIPMQVHYYYIESEGEPSEDPWMVWSNGGPGASSMYGMLTEVGPFVVNEHSQQTRSYKETGIPTLFRNPYAWTQLGGVVMFDWPPPVGFSYCHQNITGDGSSCGDWDDERMARVSYLALQGFLEQKFPSLKQNKLYLTGESYAGIYIPKLAQQIVQNNKAKDWNLQGFAVGDACTGTEVMCGPTLDEEVFGQYYAYLFLYGHGQMSNDLWESLLANCGKDHLQYERRFAPNDADTCAAAKAKVSKQVGGYFEYNLYDECTYQNRRLKQQISKNESAQGSAIIRSPRAVQETRKIIQRQRISPIAIEREYMPKVLDPSLHGAVNDYACGEGIAQDAWTAQPAVRRALNVHENSNFFSGDNGVGMNYTLTERNLLPFYHQAITDAKLKVMVYNGDADPGLNSFAAQNWTQAIGLEETEEWRPWTTDACRQMGGYVTSYTNDFTFVTIRGSGHMVPHYKPHASFAMIVNYIKDKYVVSEHLTNVTVSSLPYYDGKCNTPSNIFLSPTDIEL